MNAFEPEVPSTRPYLIRALHEWCADNGFSPYIAVQVDASVQVPMEFVKNGEIVLNVSMDATSALKLGNEFIEFKARFGGVAREIIVPVSHVIAIYARENGQGMAFPAPAASPQVVTSPGQPARAVEPASDKSQDTIADASRGIPLRSVPSESSPSGEGEPPPQPPKGPDRPGGRPQLKRVK
ncbi:ClpXP protease specificity-enhancing factor [Hydrogenophaga sp.]|uniref:ClpXP protease specificity-enhancing factor n=1 Tax=Hydrogenophaga sp. TaxID=1904254 RepID=UPI003F6EC030